MRLSTDLSLSRRWSAEAAAVRRPLALGLMVADAPRWMPRAVALWWAGLFSASVYLERSGRCVDTYQAIWGPDMKHPGNQRPINGWGMLRPPVPPLHDRKQR